MTLQLDERRMAMLREMGLGLLPRVQLRTAVAREEVVLRVEPAPAPLPVTRTAARPAGDRPVDVPQLGWDDLRQAVGDCRACALGESRRHPVFGVGPERADWMVIGEAPSGDDPDAEPFTGESGRLLDNMLRAIGLQRGRDVYIANVLKCRPPGNRNPEPQEVAQCEQFLRRQVELVQPRMVLAMGRFAVQGLLRTQEPIGRLRGKVHDFHGVALVVTFHPSYLLRNLPDKAKAWADLCMARDHLDSGS